MHTRARTFEGKEHEERKLVLFLFRVVDLAEEREMVEALHRVIVVRHDVRERVRYVPGPNDGPRFSCLPCEQEERKDDAACKDPFTDAERHLNCGGVACFG